MAKYDHINFTPPQSVRAAARRGLELRRKYGRGGLSNKEAAEQGIGSGVQRATNLANGDAVSPETIGRMVSFFARHEKNKDSRTPNGEPGAGAIAHLLWGGDPGQAWSNKVKRQMEAADMKNKSLAALAGQILTVRGLTGTGAIVDRADTLMVEKIGARHTSAECQLIQDMHDLTLQLGAECHPLTRRAGAKHSVADHMMIQRIHDDCAGLGAECKALPERDPLHYGQVMKEGEVSKGSARSGNFAHTGRPGKLGGSTKGGGHRRIGAKKDDSPQDIRDKAQKRRQFNKKTGLGEKLFGKVKNGGELKLTDGDIDVDVSIKTFGGAYGLAVKKPGDKSFGKHSIRSSNDIKNYLDQFKERKQKSSNVDIPQDLTKMSKKQQRDAVSKLSALPLKELRKRQSLNDKQIKLAFDSKNTKALNNLRKREQIYAEAIDKKEFKAALTTRSQLDAPNFLPASTPQRCEICAFFRGDEGEDYCTRFEFTTDPDYVCDDWQTARPDEIPGYVAAKGVFTRKDYNSSTKMQRRARDAVKQAIDSGKLARAETKKCFRCGKQAEEYHHISGYRREDRLKVRPVCSKCHSILDVQKADLAGLTEGILILRGGASSGNWGHAGRPKKRGGSSSGGGFNRIGVKPGASREKVVQAAKKKQSKGGGGQEEKGQPKPKQASKKTSSLGSKKLDDIFEQAGGASTADFNNHLMDQMTKGNITMQDAQALSAHRAKVQASKKPRTNEERKAQEKADREAGDRAHKVMAAEFEDWNSKLSKSENAGLVRYTGNDYSEINFHLRKGAKASKENVAAIEQIDKALNKTSLKKDITVYRGIGTKDLEKLLGSDNPIDWVGKGYKDKGFMSTSVDKTGSFDGVPLEIRVPKGSKGAYIGNLKGGKHSGPNGGEREFLLPRGKTIRVKKVVWGETSLDGKEGVERVIAEIVDE